MHIDYYPLDNWHKIQGLLAEHFKTQGSRNEVRIYKDVPQALFEICFGLIKLFKHKNSIYCFKNTSPYLSLLLKQMRLENIKVETLETSVTEDKNALSSLFKNLKSEDLFLIYFKEDPLLGKIFSFNKIEEVFGENVSYGKSLFLISVSHGFTSPSFFLKKNTNYHIDIHSLGDKGALVFLGSRSRKIETLFSPYLKWREKEFENFSFPFKHLWGEREKEKREVPQQETFQEKDLKEASDSFKERKEKILEFEAGRAAAFKAFFSPTDEKRLFDRAVIYWEDMDGMAFIDQLSKELGFSLLPPGEERRLETTSLNRWGGMKSMDWLKAYHLSDNQIRGLVMIDSSLIQPELSHWISQVREKIVRLQEG